MRKIRYAVIGSGWRAEFYIRIAKAVPGTFSLTSVLIRDKEKGQAFAEKFQVNVVNTLTELEESGPDFVVLAIRRGCVTDYLLRLFALGIPVLTETPPGETTEDLYRLWDESLKCGAKIQVAEQYYLQPLYAAWYNAIKEGLLGDVRNISISALHGYHGISMIRRILGVKGMPCIIHGKRYEFPVTETYGREGMCFDGEIFLCPRDRAVLDYEGGKTAFFDFSDPAQYHSFIRTRQLNIQGTRGEIDDLAIRYLTKENIPVEESLRRIDLGVYGNQEWSHFAIMLGERFLYRTPFVNARLNDDELAVGSLLLGMAEYVGGGAEVYPLADALQDMYLCLKLEEAYKNPWKPIQTEIQPWNDRLMI
ncbi:MAG: Gfo/Idh/MocA family oxidoreductase [Blautia sp.]|nr:Gfo/Idh/MocA family oxidoreductase [Blautia sp.]